MRNPKRKGFVMDMLFANIFIALSDEEAGKLIKAVFAYEVNEVKPGFKEGTILSHVFLYIKDCLDNNRRKYEEICERNRQNIINRWKKLE